jgi:hypothetical protein
VGVHDLAEIDPTHYSAVFETKVAYMKFKFNVTVEVTRVEEPCEIEAKIEGTPLGVVGRLRRARSPASVKAATPPGSRTKPSRLSREAGLYRAARAAGKGQGDGTAVRQETAGRVRAGGARESCMTLFELAEPRSLNEAVALLDPDDASVRPIAGGTALMLMMKAAVFRPSGIVSLRKSRSVLAERFARFLGEPPLSYLARWRLQLAGRKLQTTQQTILPDHLG